MAFIDSASGASCWRGYEYYKDGKVLSTKKISEHEFKGKVKGSGENVYDVFIDVEHPRKSKRNCPHADGKIIICKHKVALYFSLFPKEAKKYYKEVLDYERAEEERRLRTEKRVEAFIKSRSKAELQQILYDIVHDADWIYDRFVYSYIGEED